MTAGGVVTTWRREQMAERAKTNKAISKVLAPQPTSSPITPAPEPTPHTSWQSYFAARQTRAPRGCVSQMPPTKAQLVRLPEWRVGEQRPVTIPYGVKVLARYKGQLGSEEMFPASGNALGDMWVVGDNAWLWITAPGAARADWIDP